MLPFRPKHPVVLRTWLDQGLALRATVVAASPFNAFADAPYFRLRHPTLGFSQSLLQSTLAQAAGAAPFSTFSGFTLTVSRSFSPSGAFINNLMQTTLAPAAPSVTYVLHAQCVF